VPGTVRGKGKQTRSIEIVLFEKQKNYIFFWTRCAKAFVVPVAISEHDVRTG
jgi:hypothetical protein